MKDIIGTKEIVFEHKRRVYLSEHYNCDACGCLCAVNAVVVKSSMPTDKSALAKWAFDRGLCFVDTPVDFDGGAGEDGNAYCSECCV